jgi:SAM-dependent methyltransferase
MGTAEFAEELGYDTNPGVTKHLKRAVEAGLVEKTSISGYNVWYLPDLVSEAHVQAADTDHRPGGKGSQPSNDYARESTPPSVLNLGCGQRQLDEAMNVDIDPAVDPDIQHDLTETPWPFPDNAFSIIIARHILEHLPTVPWAELHRTLAPHGQLVVTYPIGHTRFEDTSHEHFWNYHSASHLAGNRVHTHEAPTTLTLEDRDVEWEITNAEPLATWYTRYRLWRAGPGPWLSQIPGLYGEITATYRCYEAVGGEA